MSPIQGALSSSSSYFEALDKPVVINILSYLSAYDLCVIVRNVSREMQKISAEDVLWKPILSRTFPHYAKNERISWEQCYKMTQFNLRNGIYSQNNLDVRDDRFNNPMERCLFHPHNGKIFSGHPDGRIKVWDEKTKKCTAILHENKTEVRCIEGAENKVFCSFIDGQIGVWDLISEQYQILVPAAVSGCASRFFALGENELFIGSYDEGICLYNFETKNMETLLDPFGHFILGDGFKIFHGKLFSNWEDGKMRVMDLKTQRFCDAFGEGIRSFAVSEAGLYCGHTDGTLSHWDADSSGYFSIGQELFKSENNLCGISSLALKGNYLFFLECVLDNSVVCFAAHDPRPYMLMMRMLNIQEGSEIKTLPLNPMLSPIFFCDGELFIKIYEGIGIINFSVSQDIILEEIAARLKVDKGLTNYRCLENFSEEIKEKIQYSNWSSFSKEQKIEAIENFKTSLNKID